LTNYRERGPRRVGKPGTIVVDSGEVNYGNNRTMDAIDNAIREIDRRIGRMKK
jgi:hypothetical protein